MTLPLGDFDFTKFFKSAKDSEAEVNKRSKTLRNSTKHLVLHTKSPDATLHHAVVAEMSHPDRNMPPYSVAYVSIPVDWLPFVSGEFIRVQSVTFIGPPGPTQKLPSTLVNMKDLIDDRLYIGFDWMRQTMQPHHSVILSIIQAYIEVLRESYEDSL